MDNEPEPVSRDEQLARRLQRAVDAGQKFQPSGTVAGVKPVDESHQDWSSWAAESAVAANEASLDESADITDEVVELDGNALFRGEPDEPESAVSRPDESIDPPARPEIIPPPVAAPSAAVDSRQALLAAMMVPSDGSGDTLAQLRTRTGLGEQVKPLLADLALAGMVESQWLNSANRYKLTDKARKALA